MKNKKIIVSSILFSLCLLVFSQCNSLKKANEFYNDQEYAVAIPHYEEALKNDSLNPEILARLGNCYRLTKNLRGQLNTYGKLIAMGKADPIQKLYYGEALTENGQAEIAKPFFDGYTADSRGKELASSASKTKMYSKNIDAYSLELAPFNSEQNDFCATTYSNSVVFVSSRTSTKWINYKHGWTDYSCLGLYMIDKNISTKQDQKPWKFSSVVVSDEFKYKLNNGPVCFNKDNTVIYFTRNNPDQKDLGRDGIAKLKIYQAAISNNTIDNVVEMPFNNKDYNYCHPSISGDGNMLFFASDKEGGLGGFDIYMCTKNGDGTWTPPANLGDKINTAGNDVFPFISSKNLLYFSSDGHDGLGGLDIYETKINDGKTGRIYNMGLPVNSKNDDFGLYLNEDNKTGYISSNRQNEGMDDDIYFLSVLREVKRGKEVLIIARDKESGEPLADTKLTINEETATTNSKGEFLTLVEDDVEYKIKAEKEDYFSAEDNVSTKSSTDDSFTKIISLEKDPKLSFLAIVTDAKTNAPLEGVKVVIKELPSNNDFDSFTTTVNGTYRKSLKGKKVGDKISYLFVLEKAGYLSKTATFIYDIKQPGEISVNQSLNLSLGKVEVGMDLAKMIDMKPIYFDLGKSKIRKDAAIELDKIVKIMKEYPNMYIELGSHTDCRGNLKANTSLSDKRAKASAAYIVKAGIDKTRIVGKGYGETKLINGCACEGKVKPNCSEDEHSKNRRTEFLITKLK